MFEKNHDILLHPKGATTMPTGIKVLVCDDDAAFCQKMADLVRRNQPEDGSSVAVTICCDPTALADKALGQFDIAFLDIDMGAYNKYRKRNVGNNLKPTDPFALLNNGFEANATTISITHTINVLGGIEEICISDNGSGICFETIRDTFGAFLASQKNALSLKIKSKVNQGKG